MQQVGTAGKGLFPSFNTIEANLIDTVGVYGKQTSGYFKAKSRENTVRNNIMMNGTPHDCCLWAAPSEDSSNRNVRAGPRAGVNCALATTPLSSDGTRSVVPRVRQSTTAARAAKFLRGTSS